MEVIETLRIWKCVGFMPHWHRRCKIVRRLLIFILLFSRMNSLGEKKDLSSLIETLKWRRKAAPTGAKAIDVSEGGNALLLPRSFWRKLCQHQKSYESCGLSCYWWASARRRSLKELNSGSYSDRRLWTARGTVTKSCSADP